MPRAHTDEEQARIRKRLLESGRARFERQGLARTTISELALDAKIGKGGFYKYFPSKEELFMEILRHEERRFREELMDDLSGGEPRSLVVGLLEAPSKRLRERPFLRHLLDPETIAELTLRLGPETMRREQEGDRKFFLRLAKDWKKLGILKESLAPEDVFAGLSGLFLLELQRSLMDEADIERTLSTMRRALLENWVRECPS